MNRIPRILYAAGPGDVVRTFEYWLTDKKDPLELAETYSGAFFHLVSKHGWSARVISLHGRTDTLTHGLISTENRPLRVSDAKGARYYIVHFFHEGRLFLDVLLWRADVLVLSTPLHWWLFAFLRVAGVWVVPSVHCTFWTGKHPPRVGHVKRLMRSLTGWFWQHGAEATLCTSSDICDQIRQLARTPRGQLHVCTPAFDKCMFESIRAASTTPVARLLFAGRITTTKGVWDMLEAAALLQVRFKDRFYWTICGDGPELESLRVAVAKRGLSSVFHCTGHSDRERLLELLSDACVIIAPTQRGFNEGLNKSVLEGALAGRPVITTSVVPARLVVGEAAVVVTPENPSQLADAIVRLVLNEERWMHHQRAADQFRATYFDTDRTWGTVLEQVLCQLMGTEVAATVKTGLVKGTT